MTRKQQLFGTLVVAAVIGLLVGFSGGWQLGLAAFGAGAIVVGVIAVSERRKNTARSGNSSP